VAAPALTVAVHPRCRLAGEALAASLAVQPGVHVVGTTQQWTHLTGVCRLRTPQVIIVDDAGDVESAMANICRMSIRWPVGQVIFVTGSSPPPSTVEWQFIPRARGLGALISALRAYRETRPQTPKGRGERLTDRELQVLTMISSGLTAPQIASQLDIGERSVENHKRRIYAKLGTHSQAHAIGTVSALGVIPGISSNTVAQLSRREGEILRLAATGQSVRQMARTLGIAPKTIESQLTLLYRKLGVHSRASALAVAHAQGLMRP
jgi:DNA-binding CsgD family transcriptional regulator